MARWLGMAQLRVTFVLWGAVALLTALAVVAAARVWVIEPVWGRSWLTDGASLVLLVGLLLGPLWVFLGRRVLRPLERVLEADRWAVQGGAEGQPIGAVLPVTGLEEYLHATPATRAGLSADPAGGETGRRIRGGPAACESGPDPSSGCGFASIPTVPPG